MVMTYLALKENDLDKTGYSQQNRGRGHLPVDRHNAPGSPQLGDLMTRPPIKKINVAYPVENVPGLQDVARGQQDHKHSSQSEKNKTVSIDTNSLLQTHNNSHVNAQGVFVMPKINGENIVSMTLYGSSQRYTLGVIRNAELIKINFPGWKLRIYTETPSTSHYGAVPKNIIENLRALGVDFYFMQPGEDFIPPMMWRFLVADDIWVDRFIVRDADARLTQRDAAAVYAWIKSEKPFTCIRDHPSHAAYAVSGGMWGGTPRELRNILRRSWRDLMRGVPSNYLNDMNFLNSVIWPKVQSHAYCLDSVSCDHWPGANPFPIPRYGYEHVGQVVNEHDLGRPGDLQILKNAGENKNCSPSNVHRSSGNSMIL
ncbi:hypothetical protein LSH36_719g01012 [Paralvinella palmiformis]|uniref:Uncharacterized protein n=1 Tax=Paralvinella palmiformis TaxID=53620 RepID=A0AAD9J1N8_9ANNE|nr:hypothetical protein LSH36_719g01012 [Paralvinella palmiformis]